MKQLQCYAKKNLSNKTVNEKQISKQICIENKKLNGR